MDATKLWLDCFFDIFKLLVIITGLCIAYAAGYEKRRKEERRYVVPNNKRIHRTKKYY